MKQSTVLGDHVSGLGSRIRLALNVLNKMSEPGPSRGRKTDERRQGTLGEYEKQEALLISPSITAAGVINVGTKPTPVALQQSIQR